MSNIMINDGSHSAIKTERCPTTTVHGRVLLTGACGQIGTALTEVLASWPGVTHLVCTDVRPPEHALPTGVAFDILDVLDAQRLHDVLTQHQIDTVYHLSAVLSARGEAYPAQTWRVNVDGWLNVLEAARQGLVQRVFFPSTIAVFGPNVPRHGTPDDAPLNPTTVYGLSKAAGENWAAYYHQRWGVDVRSLRYPGVIGHQSLPGGGTTDYAVEIFHALLQQGQYSCYLAPDQSLPMIHMDDAIRATLELMTAPPERIGRRQGYNLQGLSFSPAELVAEIERQFGPQRVAYAPDARQQIAQSWPAALDDALARADWGWQPQYDLPTLVRSMWSNLSYLSLPEAA
jgi:nucleoside-diphosphate-sugar epimerase